MSGRDRLSAMILGLAWLSFAGHQAFAQKVYKWTDKDGKINFSNVGPTGEGSSEEAAPAAPQSVEALSGAESSAEPPPSAAAASQEKSGPYSDLSEDAFSSKVSTVRTRLKRELAQAKERSREASDELAALDKQLNQPTRMGIEVLQKAYNPNPQEGNQEKSLRKEKESADKRIEEIRKEYGELHDEAVKRFGHPPSWWLPLD
jgi:Domain of unknown function (DUF4124)